MKVTFDLTNVLEETLVRIRSGELTLDIIAHTPGSLETVFLLDEARILPQQASYVLIEGKRRYFLSSKEFQHNASVKEVESLVGQQELKRYCERGTIVLRKGCSSLRDSFGNSLPFVYNKEGNIGARDLVSFLRLENYYAFSEEPEKCSSLVPDNKHGEFPIADIPPADQTLIDGEVRPYTSGPIFPNSALKACDAARILGYVQSYVANGNLRKELMMKILSKEGHSMRVMGFCLYDWIKNHRPQKGSFISWSGF